MAARDEITSLHMAWRDAHGSAAGPLVQGANLRQRLGWRLKAWIAEAAGGGDDRQLISHLIQAVDALAKRSDELSGQVADLQATVEEVFEVLSEDVTRALAGSATLPTNPAREARGLGLHASEATAPAGD